MNAPLKDAPLPMFLSWLRSIAPARDAVLPVVDADDFYGVGLKRGLRALGYIPKRKHHDSKLLPKLAESQEQTAPKPKTPLAAPRGFKTTGLYYRYMYFVKNRIRVPLSVGYNYVLWMRKM